MDQPLPLDADGYFGTWLAETLARMVDAGPA
ncbi:Uncharacterised protein [Delftia tsuruhatensis]|nr:Uncharacterised protein [Delftia tsuruhatensis]CAC9693828.1 Uncharacterised protein [Delftia tsuruhatensis]